MTDEDNTDGNEHSADNTDEDIDEPGDFLSELESDVFDEDGNLRDLDGDGDISMDFGDLGSLGDLVAGDDSSDADEEMPGTTLAERLNGGSSDEDGTADPPEPIGIDSAETAGTGIGRILISIPMLFLAFFGGLLRGILSKLPKRSAIYRKAIVWGYTAMYKNSGAHVIANTVYGDGEMVPRIATHDKEKGHLETKNGEWWTATSGLQPFFIGDTPVVTGVADHHELIDPVAARIAEAVDLGPSRRQEIVETKSGYAPAKAVQAARADGGVEYSPSTFDDIWLDVSNPVESNDGMIVSMEKAYELHWDRGSSEEMENQETRGMLAVMDPKGRRKDAMIGIGLFLLGMGASWALMGPLASTADGGTGISLFINTWV